MDGYPDGEFSLPLFPLPNLVFFPNTRLPLHVFEPRYLALVKDAMASDNRFGIVLLRAGWEEAYFGAPPIHAVATLGTIEQAVSLDDGKMNILVRGDMRVKIVGETEPALYRTARVVAQPQRTADPQQSYAQREWLADLSKQYLTYLPDQMAVPEIETVGLEALTNALIMSLNLDADEKQRLLEMDDTLARAEEIGTELQNRIESLRFLAPFRHGTDPSRN
jgi:Lon protease-like protein